MILGIILRRQESCNESIQTQLDRGLCFEHFPALVYLSSAVGYWRYWRFYESQAPRRLFLDVTCCDDTAGLPPRFPIHWEIVSRKNLPGASESCQERSNVMVAWFENYSAHLIIWTNYNDLSWMGMIVMNCYQSSNIICIYLDGFIE